MHPYRTECEGDFEKLREACPWLGKVQLRSALAYAEMWPEEIDAAIRRHEELDEERAHKEYPYLFPASSCCWRRGIRGGTQAFRRRASRLRHSQSRPAAGHRRLSAATRKRRALTLG